jgi:YVTN family beta-propeller protein
VGGLFALAVNPATSAVYVDYINNQASDALSVLNAQTGQVMGSIAMQNIPTAAAVNPTTGIIYVNIGHAIAVANGMTDKVTTTIPDANSPDQIAVDPATDTIYVANDGNNTVSVIDGSTNTVTTTVGVGSGPRGIAVDPVTDSVYVVNAGTRTMSVIDGGTKAVIATIGLGFFPGSVAVNPVTDTVYASNDHKVSVINGATNAITTTINANADGGIAADPQTDTIYALSAGGALEGINGKTNQVVTNTPTSTSTSNGSLAAAEELAVDPAVGTIYAIDAFNDNIGDPVTYEMEIITSCRAHVIPAAGSNCAKMAADLQPTAVSFASPADGVALGGQERSGFCGATQCVQAQLMATTDGGKHWSFVGAPAGVNVNSPQTPPSSRLLFTSPDDGWLFGFRHTVDGGATWQRAAPPVASGPVMAASPTTVYAVVRTLPGHRELFATPVGAVKWTRIRAFTADAIGVAISRRSVWLISSTWLWASADGRRWHRYPARCPGTGYRLAGVTATSPSHIALLCARPARAGQPVRKEVLVSADGGRTVHLAGIRYTPQNVGKT